MSAAASKSLQQYLFYSGLSAARALTVLAACRTPLVLGVITIVPQKATLGEHV